MRKTKIVATIGPGSRKKAIIEGMVNAGLDVARINMSHGIYEEHALSVSLVRAASRKFGRPVAILGDLQGTKIRTGKSSDGKPVILNDGGTVRITPEPVLLSSELISASYSRLLLDVKVGDRVLIDDGLIMLKVVNKTSKELVCRVIIGGEVKERKGLNFPDSRLTAPSITAKDKADLRFLKEIGADFIAQSFVRTKRNVADLKAEMVKIGFSVPVIAKIEKPEALSDLEGILSVADGFMVARGDLGVEMMTEKVPILQKRIIYTANCAELPVITATQMLESMTYNPRPTRAEATDVANAIFDGTDAVMLSGETATGRYPIETVATMASIAEHAEGSEFFVTGGKPGKCLFTGSSEYTVAHAATFAAEEAGIGDIVVFTMSGKTALLVSKKRPRARILALTPDLGTYSRMALMWGVVPVLARLGRHADEMVKNGLALLVRKRLLAKGARVVILSGTTTVVGGTNIMKIEKA